MGIAIGVTVVFLALLGAALWHFSNRVIHIEVWTPDQIEQFETDCGVWDREYWAALPKEEVLIPSPYGYSLYGCYIPWEEPTDKTMIIVHGVTRSHLASIKYIELFRKRGFNVLVYDHRRHGQSGGDTTSYGYYEKEDLTACVDWVLKRTGPNTRIGIHGESMGAATALQHSAIDPRAVFYIADCPYSDFAEQIAYRLKVEYRILPAFPLIPLVGMLCRIRAGFKPGEAAPIKAIEALEKPVLFIHGQEDAYIPKEMTTEMHRRKPGPKHLYLAPHADHAEAYMKNPDEYDRVVGVFLRDIGMA